MRKWLNVRCFESRKEVDFICKSQRETSSLPATGGKAAPCEMDPLGARPTTVDLCELTRWGAAQEQPTAPLDLSDSLPNAHVISPFPIREDLNQKVALW